MIAVTIKHRITFTYNLMIAVTNNNKEKLSIEAYLRKETLILY